MPTLAEQWAGLDPEQRTQLLSEMTGKEAAELLYDWRNLWAREDQIIPDGNWFCWMLMSGRGAGKTRTGAEAIREWVGGTNDPPIRIALVAESAADARDVMVEGESGILSTSPPWNMPEYSPSKRRLTWPNGSVAIHFSGDKPDQLRGPQFHKAWVDEIAKFQYPEDVWDNLELGLRLGNKPQVVVTTTPRPIPLIRKMLADPMTVISRVSTYANIGNLAPTFIARILEKYEGTRLGRQELHAEVLSDTPGALWTVNLIEANRIKVAPAMDRVVIGIDPAGSTEDTSDVNETGIVVCGKAGRVGYVMRDVSDILTPGDWAKRAITMYHEFGASRFVVEKNQGGDMAADVIRTRWAEAPIKLVHSSISKEARAEPIAALMEQGRIKHVGMFAKLEDQMTITTTDGYQGGGSPDRMDAMVHAMTALMLGSFVNTDPTAYVNSTR